MSWYVTPVSEMTLANARKLALAFMPSQGVRTYESLLDGLGGSYTPNGASVQINGYVWFRGDLGRDAAIRQPARKLEHDEIGVWWSHDPEQRIYVFKAHEIWTEAQSGVTQTVMPL